MAGPQAPSGDRARTWTRTYPGLRELRRHRLALALKPRARTGCPSCSRRSPCAKADHEKLPMTGLTAPSGRKPADDGGHNLSSRRAVCDQHKHGSVRGAPREGGAYFAASGMTHRKEVKVQTRGPDEGNPTPRRQGRWSGATSPSPLAGARWALRRRAREGTSDGSRRCMTVPNASEAP